MEEARESKSDSRESRKKTSGKINLKNLIFGLVLLVAVGSAVFFALQNRDLKANPNKVTQAEQQKLLDKVGALMTLPTDEQPSIATVSDKEKLKEQAFFKGAENGDTLLIYTNAKKAILYRESTNKIVEVAPIAIDTTQEGTTTDAVTEPAAEGQNSEPDDTNGQ